MQSGPQQLTQVQSSLYCVASCTAHVIKAKALAQHQDSQMLAWKDFAWLDFIRSKMGDSCSCTF